MLQNPSRVIKPQVYNSKLLLEHYFFVNFKNHFFYFKLKVISLSKSSRYQPLKDVSSGGIIILRDTQSDQPETLVETVKGNFEFCWFYFNLFKLYKFKTFVFFKIAGGPVKEEEESEPEPPEPFEWIGD
jgi:26S proteasome regulatory subunit N2